MLMTSESQQGRRALVMTSQFKKDLKRARKRGLPIGELEAVIMRGFASVIFNRIGY